MYLEHFGLAEPPFRITPHTDFFFDGADRGATLEALVYAILHEEGIVKVSGEVGSGKTMLCRVLIERLPAQVETVFLANPSYSRDEILYAIAEELKLEFRHSRLSQVLRELQDHLIRLYGTGRRVVVLIDEAHAMPEETLEEVRLLSNLESGRHKLLQMVLFGQPELDEALAKPGLRQLKDRITHNFRMRPLTEAEVATYLSFRMRAAGYRGPDVFSAKAVARIARASGGLTRRINILADKSLLSAFTENSHAVTPREVRAAIRDSEFTPVAGGSGRLRWTAAAAAAFAGGALLGAAALWWLQEEAPAPAPAAPIAHAPAPKAPEVPPPAPEPPIQIKEEPAPPPAPPEPPPPQLAPDQLRRLAGYAAGANKLLRERIAAARERLQTEAVERYSIELFLTENSDPARMERFLIRARDLVPLEHLYVIPIRAGSRYRIRVVYGAYPDRESAAEAASRLPPKYQRAFQTVLRTFGELRSDL